MINQGRSCYTAIVLSAIISASVLMSGYRVFTVPILQGPDEDSHLDYAFSLYSAGSLMRAAEPPSSGWNTHHRAVHYDWERISHLYTLHLSTFTNMHRIRELEVIKVSPDYGTPEYYARLDETAPRGPALSEGLTTKDNPWLLSGYPFLYYSLVAVWLKAVSLFTTSLTTLFFAARLLSVVFLVGSLILFYAILRESKLAENMALSLTGVFGLHPLTYNVASCIQPDNLSLLMVLACSYVGLLATRSMAIWIRIVLALLLGALIVTKYQFYLFTVVPWMTMLLLYRRITFMSAVLMTLPAVFAYSLELWILWGEFYVLGDHVSRSSDIFCGLIDSAVDFWGGGGAYRSYWSTTYGWSRIPKIQKVILQLVVIACAIGAVVYLVKCGWTILRVIRRRSWLALRLLTATPFILSYLLFVPFMMSLFAYTNNGFYAQGRHFFPFIPASLLFNIQLVPKLWRSRQTRGRVRKALLGGMAVYCLIATYQSIEALHYRYYPLPVTPRSVVSLRAELGW